MVRPNERHHEDLSKIFVHVMGRFLFLVILPLALSSFAQSDSALVGLSVDTQVVEVRSSKILLRNEQRTFARKMLRGGLFVHAFEGLGYATLAALPTEISGWRYSSFSNYGSNMERAFTSPPVFDSDKWYLNYVGHPYQGSLFYNAVRSQNARIWQSSLFCLGQVLVWEYVLESGLEQPSIQDLIVTPLAGIVIGELVHRGTMAMARNGFRWYEATAVILLNPMFAINNGLKYAR